LQLISEHSSASKRPGYGLGRIRIWFKAGQTFLITIVSSPTLEAIQSSIHYRFWMDVKCGLWNLEKNIRLTVSEGNIWTEGWNVSSEKTA
jgi:hypothetical protein